MTRSLQSLPEKIKSVGNKFLMRTRHLESVFFSQNLFQGLVLSIFCVFLMIGCQWFESLGVATSEIEL